MEYANAGHEKPLILCREPYYLDVMSGVALGLFENTQISVDEKQQLMGKMKALEDLLKQKIKETADRHREDELGQFIHSHFQD